MFSKDVRQHGTLENSVLPAKGVRMLTRSGRAGLLGRSLEGVVCAGGWVTLMADVAEVRCRLNPISGNYESGLVIELGGRTVDCCLLTRMERDPNGTVLR